MGGEAVIARAGLVLLLLCGLAAVSCGGPGDAGSVSVLGPWTGQEESGFRAMFAGFEKATGIHVDYTGTRDADSVLASEVHNGNPPDVAVLATPGELRQYAATGVLRPLDDALKSSRVATEYGPGVGELTTVPGPSGERHPYAIIVKAALKSLIWYDPRKLPPAAGAKLTAPGLTWNELSAITGAISAGGGRPWCMGMEDTANSGWPGTDWVEDILLHQSGPEVYDQWVAGSLPWSSGPVRRAWQAFGSVVAGAGGVSPILLTNFGRAGTPMFATPPGCFLDHQASFITTFYGQAPAAGNAPPRPGADFDFVPFPDAGAGKAADPPAKEIAADLLGMFQDTPAARKLIAYLTTPAAQQAWIRRPASGAISMNRSVLPGAYPDAISQKIARTLTDAGTVRFDASDSMPHTMAAAFAHAVLDYVANPGRLDAILSALDKVRQAAH
jgi:alpha-glucoside transport system substrate-binding protein